MSKIFKWQLIGCLLFVCHISFAQVDLITAINQQMIPLKTLSPDADFSDLAKLKPILKDKSIIGIGEATHGTHEFFVFKHRMLEFLVKEMGVKIFVIEDDFAGTQIANDYVNGKGDIQTALNGIGFGIWRTQEFIDMLNWVKTYNATQAPENKVRYFGCDMQWGYQAMQMLKDKLTPVNQFTPEMEVALKALQQYLPAISSTEKTTIKNSIKALEQIKFTGTDSAMCRHYVRELRQVMGNLEARSKLFPTKQDDFRDKCMAENVEWIYNYTNHGKMMIWAHNAHIGKSDGSDGHMRMGNWLGKNYKSDYYAMGFDFNSGSMRSNDMTQHKYVPVEMPVAKPGSSGALFAQCSAPNFILDVKSASVSPLVNTYLKSNVPSFYFGAGYSFGEPLHYVTHKLAEAYDAVIFIKETSASTDIKR